MKMKVGGGGVFSLERGLDRGSKDRHAEKGSAWGRRLARGKRSGERPRAKRNQPHTKETKEVQLQKVGGGANPEQATMAKFTLAGFCRECISQRLSSEHHLHFCAKSEAAVTAGENDATRGGRRYELVQDWQRS